MLTFVSEAPGAEPGVQFGLQAPSIRRRVVLRLQLLLLLLLGVVLVLIR
jgi:hypothetical protein